jgi:membrane-bound metal-dependent hydrolase YbcI (DUF457 family)
MPFTPFHMGFGLAAKASKPTKISLLMFGFSQVAIDLQQGYKHLMYPREYAYHGLTHTIIGATIIALLCLPFRSLLEKIFRQSITKSAAIWGAFIGVYSHLVLDSIVHRDVSANLFKPFASIDSHLYGLVTARQMDHLCVLAGIIALLILWRRGVVEKAIRQYFGYGDAPEA